MAARTDGAGSMPLSGITVLEMGENVAGPLANQILGDFGAEVIKLENPDGGDSTRQMGTAPKHGGGAFFHTVNRNKRSLVLDLADPAHVAALKRFVTAEADVVVQNLRPGVVEKFGVGEADLRALNPRLIYVNVSAFSKTGPNAAKPGYDFLMEAFGGLMSVTGEPDRPPSRVGVPAVDFSTALWVAIGILAALRRREATGVGCTVDTSLFETSAVMMSFPIAFHLFTGEVPHRWGSGSSGMAPFQAFAAADGDLAVAAGNDRIWRKFARVLGHPDWPEDPRFATPAARWENRAVLVAMIEDVMRGRDRAAWTAELEAAGIPAGPVQNVAEMLADPETAASGILAPAPGRPDVQLIQNPLSFDGARPPMRCAPPLLGDFNDDFLARYGGDGEG